MIYVVEEYFNGKWLLTDFPFRRPAHAMRRLKYLKKYPMFKYKRKRTKYRIRQTTMVKAKREAIADGTYVHDWDQ